MRVFTTLPQEDLRKVAPVAKAIEAEGYDGVASMDRGRGQFRLGGEPEKPQEAILLDFPRLKADETERRFEFGPFAAAWERPPKKVLARLERGWVQVRRLGPSRYDFEIFLILAPVDGGGSATQVVSRVEAAAASQ